MIILSDKNYIFITAACIFTAVFYLLFEYTFTNGTMGVPLDDTWIHFQYADNFTKGFFFEYNPGEPAAGTTSPLYVIVLGIFSFVITNFIINSVFLSFLFYFLSCIFIYKTSLLIFRSENSALNNFDSIKITPESISLLIAVITAFTGRLAWSALSGMETTMFIFFCILGIYFHIKDLLNNSFSLLPAIFISLATASRPEGFLLFGLYIFDVTLNFINNKSFNQNYIKLFLSLLVFAVITFPYFIFSYSISGYFFPNTFRGQGGALKFIPHFEYLRQVIIYFLRDNVIIALLYLFSVLFYFYNLKKYFKELKYVNLIFLWIIFLPLISAILIPNWRHHVRYMIPLIPFINFAGMFFFMNVLKKQMLPKKYFVISKNFHRLILLISIPYYIVYAVSLGKNTGNINDQQVKLANWVNENVQRNETIALNDIGAITFINKNRVIDIAGLITPEILRYRQYQGKENLDSVNYLLKKNNVSYIIVYDEWFKEYLNEYKDSLKFITSAILENNTICGGTEMKVYKTKFNVIKY